jgi:3-dehydroquinate synthase
MALIRSLGYNVVVGRRAIPSLRAFLKRNNYASHFILCDENTLQHCLPLLITACPELANAHVIEIESGEMSKSIEFCVHIWQTLAENNAGRDTLLVNLGGGVVSDLGGFCASVYKRGIDFVNVPTSLLAMADASIGGKTAIDFGGLKNLVGMFAQPKGVFIEPGFLQTLPERHFDNGMAEIYKMALIADAKLWTELHADKNRLKIETVVMRVLELKNRIVIKDPYDRGPRKILNFGHTIGHALEMKEEEAGKDILHGEAVLIGMIIECHIAWQKKLLAKPSLTSVADALFSKCGYKVATLRAEELLVRMRNDKKNRKNKLVFALISSIGKCVPDVEVSEAQIKRAFDFYNSLLHDKA